MKYYAKEANAALATQIVHLMDKVNLAGCNNALFSEFNRDDSVYGKLGEALAMVDPALLEAYQSTGNLPNLLEIIEID